MKRLLVVLILIIQIIFIYSIVNQLEAQKKQVKIANLYAEDDQEKFEEIRKAFRASNPGYDMTYLTSVREVAPKEYIRVLFVQEIDGVTNQDVLAEATIIKGTSYHKSSETIVGDILILREGEAIRFDSDLGLLAFKVPKEPKNKLPSFVRPDWDPNITDVPGGCATEIDAYRRILLTWREDVGEYIYHAINAHRVRIYDSFSHYHPVEGGFDEFYLVQMVKPGAKIITSEKVDRIVNSDEVQRSEVDDFIDEYELEVGDLVYLPRGVMHRGYGGVVTQVITIPGFIPGSEIGVDHHLRSINERLELNENEALPYNLEHSDEAVIR